MRDAGFANGTGFCGCARGPHVASMPRRRRPGLSIEQADRADTHGLSGARTPEKICTPRAPATHAWGPARPAVPLRALHGRKHLGAGLLDGLHNLVLVAIAIPQLIPLEQAVVNAHSHGASRNDASGNT